MENCLIQKLKGSVQNDNLPYFGEAEIEIENNAKGSLKLSVGQTAKLISVTDGTVYNVSDSQSVLLSDLLAHGTKYKYISKYDSFPRATSTSYSGNGLRGLKTNIEQWKNVNPSCLNVIYVLKTGESVIGSLDALPAYENTRAIDISNGPAATLASIIEKYPNVGKDGGSFKMYENPRVTGNVSSLAGLHYMPANLQLGPNIEGNFYDAIVGWRTNIGETGETPNIIGSSNVSLWSVQFQTTVNAKIRWTATTSSVTINGVTTTFDNSGNIIT